MNRHHAEGLQVGHLPAVDKVVQVAQPIGERKQSKPDNLASAKGQPRLREQLTGRRKGSRWRTCA